MSRRPIDTDPIILLRNPKPRLENALPVEADRPSFALAVALLVAGLLIIAGLTFNLLRSVPSSELRSGASGFTEPGAPRGGAR